MRSFIKGVPLNVLLIFSFLAVSVGVAGYKYHGHHKVEAEKEAQNNLRAIADLKASQISSWRRERIGDGMVIFENEIFASYVKRFFDNPGSAEMRREILEWMKFRKEFYDYKDVWLLDMNGGVRLSTSVGPPQCDEDLLREALRSKEVKLSDFRRDKKTNKICILLSIPILLHKNIPVGVFLLMIDPEDYLYPFIQSWPTPSETAETLLVEREGESVLFLNELRHRKDTALSLRIPLGRAELPAAMVLLGKEGVAEGVDYRDVPVLAVFKKIPDSPWAIVAKVDMSEVYAPVREHALITLMITISLIIASAFGTTLWWRRKVETAISRLNAELETMVSERTAQLRESEERFRTLFESSPVGIRISTPEGEILETNPAILKIFGYDSKEEFMRRPAQTLYYDPADRKRFLKLLEKGEVENFEVRLLRKDGSYFWASLSAASYRAEDGNIWLITAIQDITERLRLEGELIQAKRLEAVGEFAASIAHDFNNWLAVIANYGKVLMMKLKEDDPLRSPVERIIESGQKAAALTKSLLAFSRKLTVNPRPLVLNSFLKDCYGLMLAAIGEGIELKTVFSDREITVMADPDLMENALLNLAANARDAMPGGGTLTVASGVIEIDEDFIHRHGFGRPGRFALISVADTGTGMDRETLERIFEPFFTTKKIGRGTGLGLSTAYRIIRQHGGYIGVESESGRGTVFRIYLPLTTQESAESTPAEAEIVIKNPAGFDAQIRERR